MIVHYYFVFSSLFEFLMNINNISRVMKSLFLKQNVHSDRSIYEINLQILKLFKIYLSLKSSTFLNVLFRNSSHLHKHELMSFVNIE